MKRIAFSTLGLALVAVGLVAARGQGEKPQTAAPAKPPAAAAQTATPPSISQPRMTPAHPVAKTVPGAIAATPGMSIEAQTTLVKTYCATCHSERGKAGGLSFAAFDAATAVDNAPVI